MPLIPAAPLAPPLLSTFEQRLDGGIGSFMGFRISFRSPPCLKILAILQGEHMNSHILESIASMEDHTLSSRCSILLPKWTSTSRASGMSSHACCGHVVPPINTHKCLSDFVGRTKDLKSL